MAQPELIDPAVRAKAHEAGRRDELDPANLFNINWKDQAGKVRRLVLPQALTRVDASIIVLLGGGFPSGSHKVGPAYAMLMEAILDGKVDPDRHVILGPSSGNFGIGVAYICKLMGYRSIIIMPENMSRERYDRIRAYGGELDLIQSRNSDVSLTLKRMHELKRDPDKFPLAQFEMFANYRFHRHVTGAAAVEAASGIGNGRISCFVAAPGSAGTLAAADHIKKCFPEVRVVAAEPLECPTLSAGSVGAHRIQGIADRVLTLIHNILSTDFVITIHDDDAVRALKVVRDEATLAGLGVDLAAAESLREAFGVSGMCNIIASIRMARYLRLGPGDNVVTVATDGFDRYASVLEDLDRRYLETSGPVLSQWARDIFFGDGQGAVHDLRRPAQRERLFAQKERTWKPLGYSEEYLGSMKSELFWEEEYARVQHYNYKARYGRGGETKGD
jgi:cysteine synthase